MKFIETNINGVIIIEPKIFRDDRGYFLETYNEQVFHANGIPNKFVQDNQSFSSYGTVRGLHLQYGDSAQAKLVRAAFGTVLDVAVDLRRSSPTYGQHVAVELDAEKQNMLFVPRGFAHGFAVLSKTALFAYKCDNFYAPGTEGGLIYNDPDMGIDWKIPADKIITSAKDKLLPTLREFKHR